MTKTITLFSLHARKMVKYNHTAETHKHENVDDTRKFCYTSVGSLNEPSVWLQSTLLSLSFTIKPIHLHLILFYW